MAKALLLYELLSLRGETLSNRACRGTRTILIALIVVEEKLGVDVVLRSAVVLVCFLPPSEATLGIRSLEADHSLGPRLAILESLSLFLLSNANPGKSRLHVLPSTSKLFSLLLLRMLNHPRRFILICV